VATYWTYVASTVHEGVFGVTCWCLVSLVFILIIKLLCYDWCASNWQTLIVLESDLQNVNGFMSSLWKEMYTSPLLGWCYELEENIC